MYRLRHSKAREVKEKEKLKTTLKWEKFFFDVILDREIFTYLKNKSYLILTVNSRNLNFSSFNWNNLPCYSCWWLLLLY